jgi:hypothetical protein
LESQLPRLNLGEFADQKNHNCACSTFPGYEQALFAIPQRKVIAMLIQTTTKFDNCLDAQDSLRGLKDLPGFCYGYITEQNAQKFEVITIIKCQSGDPAPTQKHVIDFCSGTNGISTSPSILTPQNLEKKM